MNFVIYTADCTGNKANCDYPHRVEVDSPDVLQKAVKKDHVCAEYKGNYRSKDNFVTSNAIVMDVDTPDYNKWHLRLDQSGRESDYESRENDCFRDWFPDSASFLSGS